MENGQHEQTGLGHGDSSEGTMVGFSG